LPDIADRLVRWFIQNQRILPWRDNPEPYRVWVSEIMLQQTRVQTVLSYYHRFMEQYPCITALANASLEDVLNSWQGLGYYSRAKNLHKAAKIIQDQYHSIFPQEYDEILKLPGIGKYTAAAVLSIAFNQPFPVVDGNVMRVISRLFGISTNLRLPKTVKMIEMHLNSIFPAKKASDFNQGMMELGALICLPQNPKCEKCPISMFCAAYKTGKQADYPNKSIQPKPKVIHRTIVLIRKKDKYLVHKRNEKGLLASMWEFPGVDSNERTAISKFETEYGFVIDLHHKLFDTDFTFTHRIWKMSVYEASIRNELDDSNDWKWLSFAEMTTYPFPKAFSKIMEYCKQLS